MVFMEGVKIINNGIYLLIAKASAIFRFRATLFVISQNC